MGMTHAPKKTDAINHRRSPRLRALLGATITFNNGSSTVDCLIRDISESGARLAVPEAVTLPAAFELFIPRKNKKRPVEMLWRRADVVGVSFADQPGAKRPGTGEAALKRELRESEAELARLRNRIAQLTEG
jgi:hypothetical protein